MPLTTERQSDFPVVEEQEQISGMERWCSQQKAMRFEVLQFGPDYIRIVQMQEAEKTRQLS